MSGKPAVHAASISGILAPYAQIIAQPKTSDALMSAVLDAAGEHYSPTEGKLQTWRLARGEKLVPWYNKRGTEFLQVVEGSAIINGVTATKGELARIDAGEIVSLATAEGCELRSHIFPYRRHLAHIEFKAKPKAQKGPLVSIVIIAKDIENHLGHCISSCINQTHGNVQVIVVDDNSADSTLSRARSMASYDSRIEVYTQSLGMNGVRRYGIERARGEFCMIIDGDDWLRDDAVERLVKIADEKSSECIAFGFDHYNDKTRAVWDPVYPSHVPVKSPPFYYEKTNHTAFETSHLHHTVWMYFFSIKLKDAALKALIHIYQYEDIPFYLTLMQHAQHPTMCNYILHHYRRERAGQSTANWVAVNHTQKRACFEISVKHALSLMQPHDWFHRLILLYKIKRIVNHELGLMADTRDVIGAQGWQKQWRSIARLFPAEMAERIVPEDVKKDFMGAHDMLPAPLPVRRRAKILSFLKKGR